MKNAAVLIVMLYLVIINAAGFCTMGADKYRAKRGMWRIREVTLFVLALAGGSFGSWIGMYLFRHKTRHWYFVVGIPLIFLLEILGAVFVLYHTGWYGEIFG